MVDQKDIKQEALEPRRGFLTAGGVTSILGVLAYLYEETIVMTSGPVAFAVILVFLVLVSLFLILCYRKPVWGNRLLGYDIVLVNPDKKIKSDVQYSGGFKAETGAETKRMNSRRKQARYARRKLAQVTREMQSEKTDNKSTE